MSTLVPTVGVSSHHVLFLPFCYQSSSVHAYTVSLTLMSSRISALSLLNGGALSLLVSTVVESSRHFFGFPFYYQPSSIVSCFYSISQPVSEVVKDFCNITLTAAVPCQLW